MKRLCMLAFAGAISATAHAGPEMDLAKAKNCVACHWVLAQK